MSKRPRLTHHGVDVDLRWRTNEGKAVVWYLDRHGNECGGTNRVNAWELSGLGWGLTEIKTLIKGLPLYGSVRPATPAAEPIVDRPNDATDEDRPRGFLHSHFSAPKD